MFVTHNTNKSVDIFPLSSTPLLKLPSNIVGPHSTTLCNLTASVYMEMLCVVNIF